MSTLRIISITIRKTLFLPLLLLLVPGLSMAIDTPQNPRGTEVAQSLVKWEWDWVPGAVQYEVTVDGSYINLTRDPQYFSSNLWAGEHSLTVRSIDSNGQYSNRSATSKISVSAQFNPGAASSSGGTAASSPAVTNRSGSQNISPPTGLNGWESGPGSIQWQWNPVEGAVEYELTVDGQTTSKTADSKFLSQGLWVGEHSLTVRAIGVNGGYSEASGTHKVWLNTTGSASGSSSNETRSVAPAPNPAPPPAQNDNGPIDPASWSYGEVYNKAGYTLSFSDEFNSGSLNRNRWNTQLRWDGEFNGERYEYRIINGEKQFYVNMFANDQGHKDTVASRYNPFELNGSRLAIRAIKNPLKLWDGNATHGDLYSMVSQQPFLSGAISTYDKFTQKHGYFEARIKIPNHEGTFPAFWLHHQKRRWEGTKRSEIDVMENLGHAPWYVYNSFHFYENVSTSYGGDARFIKPQPQGQIYTGKDYSQDYHVYAVEWKPGYIRWLIDGETVSELWNSNVDYEELYVILNLAMGGNWTNFPASIGGLGRDSNNYYPNQNDMNNFGNPALEIDYVRVYKPQ